MASIVNHYVKPELGETKQDKLVSWFGTALELVPVGGPILNKLLTTVIPEQRTERIEEFVKILHARLYGIEQELLHRKESAEIFEKGATMASRSTSTFRIDHIAKLVAHGMSGDEQAQIEARRLLSLMESIDDDQIIILASHLSKYSDNEDFHSKHKDVLDMPLTYINGPQHMRDLAAVKGLAKNQLTLLGLLAPQFKKPTKGQLPEFDEKTGMMKASYIALTPLGRLLLTRLEIAGPDDF